MISTLKNTPVREPIRAIEEDGFSSRRRKGSQDISLGGVFIFTNIAFQEGQQIRILFSNGGTTRTVKMMGKVARATPEGIGVEFLSSDIDKITAILSLASEG